jgi:carbohydrate kinase (thermoresistant glucokinase family)
VAAVQTRRTAIVQGADHTLAIVLIGVSGSGKTTVGKRLAPAIDATFLEGDDYHSSANIAKMRSGTPLADEDRWPWLEKLGVAIAAHVTQGRSVVVSCSALRHAYRAALSKAAGRPLTFVHLTIDPAILEARMKARHQHFMPASLLESQLATLEPLAPDEQGTEIVETGTSQQTVAAIERWLRLRSHGRVDGHHEKGRHGRPSTREKKPKPVGGWGREDPT